MDAESGLEKHSSRSACSADHSIQSEAMALANADFSPTTLPEPWRKIPWGNKERDLQLVMDYRPHNDELHKLRIMMCGPPGSGKSSFINSVDTVLKGRLAGQALAGADEMCVTKEYRSYKMQKGGPGNFFPFLLSDTRAFEACEDRGIRLKDIKLALKGHIRDGYEVQSFNPQATISEADGSYNITPGLNDRVHVLVFVFSATSVTLLCDDYMRKMRAVRVEATAMGIPQVAILTNIDQNTPVVSKNIRNVYTCVDLKRRMEYLSRLLGVPLYSIFPVRNYDSEIDINEDIDTLILSALKHIITHGEDFVNRL